jgi:hypothetical protein
MRKIMVAMEILLVLGFILLVLAWTILWSASGASVQLDTAKQFADWEPQRVAPIADEEPPAKSDTKTNSKQAPWHELTASDRLLYLIPWAWVFLPWATAGYGLALILGIGAVLWLRLAQTKVIT